MKRFVQLIVLLLLGTGYAYAERSNVFESDTPALRTIIVVFDGLRPDYIKPEWMPRLFAFSKKAAYGKDHHSVFPTVTRVNAASYITGSYPAMHGLVGNSLYLPTVNALKSFDTGEADSLRHIMKVTSGKLLTSPSLGEVLHAAGERLFVYSSGTTGQAFLQNHTVNGAIINPDMILPEAFRTEVAAAIGSPPAEATPNAARHHWITDALCRYTLAPGGPLVSAIWFSDPDHTAHEHGIGVPLTIQALQSVDAEFGRILDSMQAKGLETIFNIIVTADHGFVTRTGKQGLSGFLIEKGLKESTGNTDVISAGGAVYVKDHDPERIKKIVEALQKEEWVGAVFTRSIRPGSMKGWVKGTLSFESVHWDHPQRAADILVAESWNNNTNGLGYAGSSMAGGVAGHGGSSPYETHIALMAYGPSFTRSFESELPTSNIDIVPTVLYLHHIAAPSQMQGRVMNELLRVKSGVQAAHPRKQTLTGEVRQKWGTYKVIVERTLLGQYSYINYAQAVRTIRRK
jgi:hypothetical protein